jgi:hypothetical protein
VVCAAPTPAAALAVDDCQVMPPVNVQLAELVKAPFVTRFVAAHARQHVATLQVDPGTHGVA